MGSEDVPFENGKCLFNDDKINVAQKVYDTENCRAWACLPKNSTHGMIIGAWCGVVTASPECKYGTGEFPDCCPSADCPDYDGRRGIFK
ncbi:hypothetical protein MTO96_018406 [Rhipicephalus appendiculatus]